MRRVNVVVAITSPDVKAEVIAESVAQRPDMHLVGGKIVLAGEIGALLETLPTVPQCALVLVGHPPETTELAQRWLAERDDLVVVVVDIVGELVRIALRDPRLDALLAALRGLVERVGRGERVTHIELRPPGDAGAPPRPLLKAASDWVHAVLRDAIERVPDENGDVHGFSVTRTTLLQSLDLDFEAPPDATALHAAFKSAKDSAEPLAVAERMLDLSPLEFRLLVLALAPELDLRFQHCLGLLLDDMGRRVGTAALYGTLLGATPRTRDQLLQRGALARWLVFDGPGDRPASADEPLRGGRPSLPSLKGASGSFSEQGDL